MPDVKLWAAALNGMPGVDAGKWQHLDPVARWLLACRASVLFMTLAAAMLGGLLAWLSLVFALGPATVLLGKHTDKLDADRQTSVHTLPVLLVFASIPSLHRSLQMLRTPKPETRPESYPEKLWPLWFSAACFRHTRHFTPLFLLGLVLDTLLQ